MECHAFFPINYPGVCGNYHCSGHHLEARCHFADEPNRAGRSGAQVVQRSKRSKRNSRIPCYRHPRFGHPCQSMHRITICMERRGGRCWALFADPKHPYTEMLLDSLHCGTAPLRLWAPPSGSPSGCGFHPRCPQAMERYKPAPNLLEWKSVIEWLVFCRRIVDENVQEFDAR